MPAVDLSFRVRKRRGNNWEVCLVPSSFHYDSKKERNRKVEGLVGLRVSESSPNKLVVTTLFLFTTLFLLTTVFSGQEQPALPQRNSVGLPSFRGGCRPHGLNPKVMLRLTSQGPLQMSSLTIAYHSFLSHYSSVTGLVAVLERSKPIFTSGASAPQSLCTCYCAYLEALSPR